MAQVSQQPGYGLRVALDIPYDQAVTAVTEALKTQGFGVLTEIDVKATMKKKLDKNLPPYLILGACNPGLAFRALSNEVDIGLLLPCNVVVYKTDETGKTIVAAIDPEAMMSVTDNPELTKVALEAKALLVQALESL
ncbi:MAG: DUF302 domain-containing protein [Deltaproteobacteria bacterium]|nr:DUF302 domain-containing protein [Deltaproteobacteria bacterium]